QREGDREHDFEPECRPGRRGSLAYAMRSLDSPYPPVRPLPARTPAAPLIVAALVVVAVAGGAVLPRGEGYLAATLAATITGAIVCARLPAVTVISLFALTGFENTLQAYAHIYPERTADLILAGLWVGVMWAYLRGSRD